MNKLKQHNFYVERITYQKKIKDLLLLNDKYKKEVRKLSDRLRNEKNANCVLTTNYDNLLKQVSKIKWKLRDVSMDTFISQRSTGSVLRQENSVIEQSITPKELSPQNSSLSVAVPKH